jgi:hypothetical protein
MLLSIKRAVVTARARDVENVAIVRADEQFTMIGIALGASVLFVAVMWVLA